MENEGKMVPQQILHQQKKELTLEQRKRLDRQRFIGLEVQRKLLNSKVLITPANGTNTELAKNLVLAGVNISIYDNAIVDAIDYQTNFLISHDDLGKNRGQVVFQKLKEMNPNGHNQLIPQSTDITNQPFLKKFNFIATSFTNFQSVKHWDILTKKHNITYYNLVNAGLHAFVYISLGATYTYTELTNNKSKITTVDVLTLEECLNGQIKNSREYNTLSAIYMMNQAQKQQLKYDAFSNQQKQGQILKSIVEIGMKIKKENNKQMLANFGRCYGIDFCPTYSVIGSIISQQVIKVVQNKYEPAMNWLVYNSQEGYANVVKLEQQLHRIKVQEKQIS